MKFPGSHTREVVFRARGSQAWPFSLPPSVGTGSGPPCMSYGCTPALCWGVDAPGWHRTGRQAPPPVPSLRREGQGARKRPRGTQTQARLTKHTKWGLLRGFPFSRPCWRGCLRVGQGPVKGQSEGVAGSITLRAMREKDGA